MGELGAPFAGAPLGRGGRGTEGGGDGRELCEELLRIVELELDRLTSPLRISLYFICLTISQSYPKAMAFRGWEITWRVAYSSRTVSSSDWSCSLEVNASSS